MVAGGSRVPRGEARRDRAPIYGPGEHEVSVRLGPGENAIVVEGYSVLGEVRGEPTRVDVRLEGVEEPAHRLHLAVVSVGRYRDPDLDLDLADADARSVVEAFGRQNGRLYDEVRVTQLADASATREGVLAMLDRIARDASPEDALVFYVAGHGVVGRCPGEASESYHLILHGATRASPCGDEIGAADLTRRIAQIAAQEKLLLLDTCQAGGVIDETAMRSLNGGLRDEGLRAARASGVAMVSAAAASQSSFEVSELGHGLFTVALLRGLEGRARFGEPRRVGVTNLVRYVSRYLPILSERYVGRVQTPTFGAMGRDFTLAVVDEADPPLVASTTLPRVFDDASREASRGLEPDGRTTARAQLQLHVDSRRDAIAACGAPPVVELGASWSGDRVARFDVRGSGAGTPVGLCIARAIGPVSLSGEAPSAGEAVLVVGTVPDAARPRSSTRAPAP